MFEEFMGGGPAGFDKFQAKFREELAARAGNCPSPRRCEDSRELADWFRLAGVAAGAISRIGAAKAA
jgi:hypothetical protein